MNHETAAPEERTMPTPTPTYHDPPRLSHLITELGALMSLRQPDPANLDPVSHAAGFFDALAACAARPEEVMGAFYDWLRTRGSLDPAIVIERTRDLIDPLFEEERRRESGDCA
jgi:hypothetical protein